ncbi:MAG: hypothetical protein ACI9W2_002356, partial [Gammaproteobacteria bacterium]
LPPVLSIVFVIWPWVTAGSIVVLVSPHCR